MLQVHEFSSTSNVIFLDTKVTLAPQVESEVEYLWQDEQKRRGKPLFNGKILSAVEVSTGQILGRFAEYRHLIAQRARPELFDALRVRPVAVSGLLKLADGIVFGKRSGTVTQDAGLWELVPSGGVDTSKISVAGEVDYRAQIKTELREEIGIEDDLILSVRPFCLIDDIDSHVLDIGIELELSLSTKEVQQIHCELANNEYDVLRVVPFAGVDAFISDRASKIVGISRMLIQQFLKQQMRY